MSTEMVIHMYYADTAANENGTVSAFCYCGWSDDCDTQESADADEPATDTDTD